MPYPTHSRLALPEIEKEILAYWKAEKIFEQTLTLRESSPAFIFYEGPPGANGLPGIHHVISRVIKDLFCRYKSQRGFYVARKAGWDTHGLPVELSVEKRLQLRKEDIGTRISVAEYNRICKEDVFKFKEKWDDLSERIGYWLDMAHPYITCDTEYIESLWWVVSELYKKDYLYKSWSIQPYSPAAGTGLSTHELNQPGAYKMVKDTSITAMCKLGERQDTLVKKVETELRELVKRYADQEGIDSAHRDIYFLAWTTTPWTLPSNLGLAVGKNMEYELCVAPNPYSKTINFFLLASARRNAYLSAPAKVLARFTGQALAGLRYEPLFPNSLPKEGDPFRVVVADFVSTEEGTGIVHMAPAHGADDYAIGRTHNLGMLLLVDKAGRFKAEAGAQWAGRYVKNYTEDPNYIDPNIDIAVDLKKRGLAFKIEKYEHNYPHCWRTGKPILYYPMQTWFVRVSAVKARLIELNHTIHWQPEATGTGRFGKWLENVQDWNLSRSRFWGTPLPIWRTKDGKEEKCIGSLQALREEIKKASHLNSEKIRDMKDFDLHKPWLDEIRLLSVSGQVMYREPDLLDVWFDSGAMPYAQWHYPFENEENFKSNFPADLVCEGVDQTRGWFYTLHVLACLLFDSVAFKHVLANGLVLDKYGEKMSKRLHNTVDPFQVLDMYGADSLRWYLITNASPWDNLRFDESGIQEVQRKFLGTLFNTYQFFALYANLDGFTYNPSPLPYEERPLLDQWIISVLHSLIKEVREDMDAYDATSAYRKVESFVIDELSNWYVRLGRKRFWKQERVKDKEAAYESLRECLLSVALLCSPGIPFFSEFLFRSLSAITGQTPLPSVHTCDFPDYNPHYIQKDIERKMKIAQDIASAVLSIRKAKNIKVRQPLSRILVPADSALKKDLLAVQEFIVQETNVKEIVCVAEDNTAIKKKLYPNYALLGKRLGGRIKAVAQALAGLHEEEIKKFEKEERLSLRLEDTTLDFQKEELILKMEGMADWEVVKKKGIVLALDLHISEDLKAEGLARELVNRIQRLRKEQGFDLSDTIQVQLMAPALLQKNIHPHSAYICKEVLCEEICWQETLPEQANRLTIDDMELKILLHPL